MRPRNEVHSILLHTPTIKDGEYIPRRVEVNSWVVLQPGKRGGHAQDSKKYGPHSIVGAYKAQILEFQVAQASTSISAIKVQHAYMHRQLCLDPNAPVLQSACNYLYPLTYIDLIDPLSIMEPICVVHADVGEASKGSRNHKQLLEDSIFFYNARYYPSTTSGYGHLEAIPLPDFNDAAWTLLDMLTSEAFRAKLREDFLISMKPNTGSRVTHINWFMPIGVMVDLFACARSIHKTRTLFVFKDMSDELFASLMDRGWHEKVVIGDDVIKCLIDPTSVLFKYHIGRSILYATFQFNRLRLIQAGRWEPMDQSEPIQIVKVDCVMGNWTEQLEVGLNWTLQSIRSEIQITLALDAPIEFTMYIDHDGHTTEKVNRRNEKKKLVVDVLPSKRLVLVTDPL